MSHQKGGPGPGMTKNDKSRAERMMQLAKLRQSERAAKKVRAPILDRLVVAFRENIQACEDIFMNLGEMRNGKVPRGVMTIAMAAKINTGAGSPALKLLSDALARDAEFLRFMSDPRERTCLWQGKYPDNLRWVAEQLKDF